MFSQKELQDWKNAKGGQLPDGNYRALVQNGKFITTAEGKKKLIVQFKIIEPEAFKNLLWSRFMNLDSQEQMFYTYRDLLSLGMDGSVELPGLAEAVTNLAGSITSFDLETNGKYQNFRITKQAQSTQKEPDDIPF